ncbi:MAG: fumarate hydratase [Chitinispirillaceae bacterium]|nr:fumarate hydratase [Chitinispirillaceae bacterium]
MRTIPYIKIVEAVKNLCVEAASILPVDTVAALKRALKAEESQRGKEMLRQCIENAKLAACGNDPICQDTGVAVYFVEFGAEAAVSGGSIIDAINEGTRLGYREGYLRKSIVADPLFDRKNTGDNTPAVTHIEIVKGDAITISLLPKGAGSENCSALAMLKPADGPAAVVNFVVDTVVRSGGNSCPPVIVGVGIGGTADKAILLAKKALLRPVGKGHADERYAELERRALEEINASGVGPQGLGGTITALAVHIEAYPCHMASLPVAVNLNCHAARKAAIRL